MSSLDLPPIVFVILPVHNRLAKTIRFVQMLRAQTYQNFRLILVDDGSRDGTSDQVRSLDPQAYIVQGDGNLWWGGGVAAGLDKLQELGAKPSDLILIVNDDTEIQAEFLEQGVSILKRNPRKLLLARGHEKNGKVVESGSKILWPIFRIVRAQTDQEINCAPTRGLLFTVEVYRQIGSWIPQILPHYCSDYEFTCRAIRKGFPVFTDPHFLIEVDLSATGIDIVRADNSKDYFDKVFSLRSIRNPITVSKFIWLCSPWYFVPMALAKVWIGFVLRYFQFLLGKIFQIWE